MALYSPLEREERLEAPPAPPHSSSSEDAPLVMDSSMKDEQSQQTCWQAASIGKCDRFREVSGHRRNWWEQAQALFDAHSGVNHLPKVLPESKPDGQAVFEWQQ